MNNKNNDKAASDCFTLGQMVYSKAGRDKRRPFIITGIDGEYLFLADGNTRKLIKPKKKKKMHVQLTYYHLSEDDTNALVNGRLLDANIRRFLQCLRTI